jgi:glycosyltransferase involved in cell wall biosynthesis
MMISIIIPCCNAQRTIGSTIESALIQEVEKEVIVIDDGSTDDSRAIIASFGARVRAEFGPNHGVSAARNRGGELARGRFLQFVDSDDQLTPGTLQKRLAAITDSDADAAYTDWQKLRETIGGIFVQDEIIVPPRMLLETDAEAACADSRFWLPPVAILYRREIVERVGGWRANLPVIQDARFLFDVAAQGAKFCHVSGVGALYRVSAGSLSRRNRPRFMRDCFINAQEIEAHWRKRATLTPARIEVLRAMWHHAAMAALVDGAADFEAARRNHNAIGPRRLKLETGWFLRRVLTPAVAGVLVRRELRRRGKQIRSGHDLPQSQRMAASGAARNS